MSSLIDFFEKTVKYHRDNVAIRMGDVGYSYKISNKIANKIARCLKDKGVQKGDNVGIYLKKTENVLFIILGLLKLGATYVPIDSVSPINRVEYIKNNSGLKMLISSKPNNDDNSCIYENVDELLKKSQEYSSDNIYTEINTDDPAYIIYTSGSTGNPKGVSVSHGNVISLFDASNSLFNFNSNDKWTLFHSCAFDFSVWEMWGAWVYGGEVIVVSYEDSRNPISFVDLMVRSQTTVLNITPSAFFEMIGEIIKRQHELNLRYVIFGGEALNFSKLQNWFTKENTNLPKLINMYGITETTVHVTYKLVSERDVEKGITNIGKVLPHLDYKIINQEENEVAQGEIGELYVSGKGLSLGYFKNPVLNEERFIYINGIRYYKSGDIVKLLANNELQYLYRNDEQIQLRGYRIELGEIEAIYNNMEQIKNCVVIANDIYIKDMQLILYYVSDKELSTSYLRKLGMELLPLYMVPSFFVAIDSIPLTTNGKLDKSQLPIPSGNCAEENVLPGQHIAATNKTIQKIRNIMENEIGYVDIDNNDSFLELGINSLLMMRITIKIKEIFDVELMSIEILRSDSITELSDLIESRMSNREQYEYIKNANLKSYPLSYEQENLWFIHKTNKDKSLYNINFSYEISGKVEKEVLELSLNQLSDKHQILKSVIQEETGKGFLTFVDSIYNKVDFYDLTDKSSKEQDIEINNIIKKESERSFDVEKGPLLSSVLIKKDREKYQLVCTIHHIIFDGLSKHIFIEEWFNLYEKMLEDSLVYDEEYVIQYGDYANWQKTSQNYIDKAAQEFWIDEVSKVKQRPLLPYDYPKTENNKRDSETIQFVLSEETRNAVVELSRESKSTLFMTMLTAYQTFLSVYLDNTEVVVGSPLTIRNKVETEKMIGYFVNTLPFILNVSAENTFKDILKRNIKKISEVFNYRNIPTEQILRYLPVSRNIDSAPLFDTVFVLENNTESNLTYNSLRLKTKRLDSHKAKFDLVVQVEEIANNDMLISFEYNKQLFKKSTIQRMANNFNHWLNEITIQHNHKLKEQSYIELEQLHELKKMSVNKMKGKNQPYKGFESIISRFERIAEEQPGGIAIVQGKRQVTYKELNESANMVAHQLNLERIEKENRVGVYIERSIEMVIAILAIMKTGAVYVPLDPSQPDSRLKYMIDDSETSCCITTRERVATIPTNSTKLILIDEISDHYNDDFQTKLLSEGDLAYIIYTSGTTGRPKGVMVEHGGLSNLCDWHIDYYSVTNEDTAIMVSNSSFDASIWELFPYITNGSRLVIMNYWDLLEVDVLSHKMKENNVSLAFFSTGLLEQLFINEMEFPETVRAVLTGGDRLKKVPNNLKFDLYNNYGPTEGTVVSTVYKIKNNNIKNIPIGKPITNVETYIFNSQMNLTPIGHVGELYIGGKGIARGYINDEEKNNENFVINPFKSNETLYKTGDLVKYNDDGDLIFLGRKDDQVKIRGFRIELEEIGFVLREYTGIKDCVITIKEEIQKNIIAYYVSNIEIEEELIREYMQQYLPSYMMPTHFIRINSIPLTINGKVDLRELPNPKNERVNNKKTVNQTEKEILKIWRQVLNNQKLTIYDNYFECGGDSILSIQISTLAKEKSMFFTSKDIFEKQTIIELAKIVKSKNTLSINQLEVHGETLLTPIQHWFFRQCFSNVHHWNQSVTLIGYPYLNKRKLERIINKIVDHHDGLRTNYILGRSVGYVEKKSSGSKKWSVEYFDYSGLSDAEKQEKIDKLEKETQQTINIFNGLLMNVVCIKVSQNEHKIIWVIHHLVVDGVSWRILIEDLDQLYNQVMTNQVLTLKRKTTSFKDWADKLNNYKQSIPKKIKDYWSYKCNRTYDNALKERAKEYNEARFEFNLTKDLTRFINSERLARYDATVNEIHLSIFTMLLGRYFNKSIIPITLEGHGREEVIHDVDLSRTIGWFTTMYPIYLEVAESLTEIISLTKENYRSIPNNGFDYGILTELHDEKYDPINKPIISYNNLGRFDLPNQTEAKEITILGENDIKHNEYKEHEIDIELSLVNGIQKIRVKYNEGFVEDDFEEYIQTKFIKSLNKLKEDMDAAELTKYSKEIAETKAKKELLNQLSFKNQEVIDVYNLTEMQKGMLYHSLFDYEGNNYKVQLLFEIKGSFNNRKMQNAVRKTLAKYDVLNTTFHSTKQGLFYQVLIKQMKFHIEYHDLTDSNKTLDGLIKDQVNIINVEKNLLSKFLVVKVDNSTHLLVWSFHHIIMDGWSYSTVINEIFKYYQSGKHSVKEDNTFKAYVEYMDEYVKRKDVKAYWLEKTKRFINNEPTLIENSFTNEYIENTYFKEIDTKMKSAIRSFCSEFKVTTNSFFLTIWLSTLRDIQGTVDICCGIVTSGRNIPIKGVENIIGPLINTVPFIKKLKDNQPMGELVKEVQNEFLELISYENTPLSKIYEWIGHDAELFESLYSFENYPMTLPSTDDFEVKLQEGKETTHYPITIIIDPNKGIQIKFNEAMISKSVQSSIISSFNKTLNDSLTESIIY